MSAIPANVSDGLAKQIAGGHQEKAPDRPRPAHRHGQPRHREVLDAEGEEHEPDEDADRGHGRLVELEDDEPGRNPRDARDEQDPPVAGELAGEVANDGIPDASYCGVTACSPMMTSNLLLSRPISGRDV